MSKIRCLLTALLLAGAPAFASAEPPEAGNSREDRSEEHFRKADANGDGYLTFEETEAARAARRAERFAKMDKDGDRRLSREEIRAGTEERREHRQSRRHERRERMRERMHARLDALDTDHDQAISRAEVGNDHPRLAERFDSIDANRDGKLTREEMHARPRREKAD
jgi:Ca2+-binding EF-hand superfamily protein